MNNNISPQIKPFLSHRIHIKSLYTYQDFLRKRPKKALAFRFSAKEWNYDTSKKKQKRSQAKLFKALELAKHIRKVDLSKLMLEQDHFRTKKLLSAFKKISKVKTVYMYRMLRDDEEEICIEKSLKCLKDIQHLRYQLIGSNQKLWSQNVSDRDCEYPLKYLQCCLKLKKLLITDSMRCYCFSFNKTSCKSPSYEIQKNTMINNLLVHRPFSTEFFDEMISLSYWIYTEEFDYEPHKTYLRFIQELPNLQEINMKFQDFKINDLENILEKIAEKGTLKKVKLDFNFVASKLEKILKALKNSKLTSFSLKTLIKDNRVLTSIATFLQGMSHHLEFLKLDLSHSTSFNNSSNSLNEICKQINKLDKLQHLKLAFNAKKKVPKEQRLPNFLSDIYPAFTKQIKLKTLGISCNQVDHSEAFPDLIAALQTLQPSLEKLKIDIGAPSRSPKSHNIVVNLIRNLSNIKVLKFPCISVNSNRGLNIIRDEVLGLKNLEEFIMGEIDDKVDVVVFLDALEKILCTRGLRKFYCLLTKNLREKVQREIKGFPQYNYELKELLKTNPCLEVAHFSRYDEGLELTSEIQKWASYKIPYCDLFYLDVPFCLID